MSRGDVLERGERREERREREERRGETRFLEVENSFFSLTLCIEKMCLQTLQILRQLTYFTFFSLDLKRGK
jgi:hypothetical protein